MSAPAAPPLAASAPPAPPAAPPATPPAPAPAPPTPPKPDDLRSKIQEPNFWKNILGADADKPAEPAPGEPAQPTTPSPAPAEPPKPADAAPAPAAPAAAAAPATTEPKKKAPKKRELSTSEAIAIATDAATKAATEAAMRTARQPEAPTAPITDTKDIIASLPEDLRDDAETYAEMQALWPDKYGTLIAGLAAYAKKEEEYSRAWQKEHPNAEFDPEAEEHDDFYDRNKPKLSKKDFREAERSIIERRTEERLMKKFEPQFQEIEMQRKEQAVIPQIATAAKAILGQILTGLNTDYTKLADKPDELAKLGEKDPIAGETAAMVFERYQPLVAELVKLFSGAAKFNDRNSAHVALGQIADHLEFTISKLPAEQRLDEQQRMFSTRAEYHSLPAAERAKRWTLELDHVLEFIGGKAQVDAENLYKTEQDRLDRYAKARGLKTETSAAPQAGNGQPPAPVPAAEPVTSPSPTVPGRTAISTDKGGTAPPSSSWIDGFGFGGRPK